MQLFSALIICLTLSDVSRTQIINHHIPKIINKDLTQLKWPKLNIVAHLPMPNGTLKKVHIYQDPGSVRRNSNGTNDKQQPLPVIGQQYRGHIQQPIGTNLPQNNFLERKFYNFDQLKYAPKNVDHVETYAIKLSELHKYLENNNNNTVNIRVANDATIINPPRNTLNRTKIPQNSPRPHLFEKNSNLPKSFWGQVLSQNLNNLDKKFFRDKISELTGQDTKENFDVKAVKQDKNGIFFYENILKNSKINNKNVILVTSLNNTAAKEKMVFLELKKANNSTINSSDFKNKAEPLIITSIYRQFLHDLSTNAPSQKQLLFRFKLDPIKQLPNNNAPNNIKHINNRYYNK